MGKTSKRVKGKTKFSPLPTNDLFKDFETPTVHDLNPIASAVFHEFKKALPRTSNVFDDFPMSTPRAGLGKLVEGDVRDGSAKGDDVPSVDCSTPVVDGGYCGVSKVNFGAGKEDPRAARGKEKKANGRKGFRAPIFEAIGPKGHPNRSPLTCLEFVKVGEEVTLDVEDVTPLEEPKGFCLAGYFSDRFPGLRTVHQLKDSWKVKCKVIYHQKGWVVFRFDSDTDRQRVLDGRRACSEGAYMVHGKMFSLRILPDGFSPDDAAFLKVPLWVKFPSLPQRCWTKSGFRKISSMIGNSICLDQITWDRSRTL
ncbi:hypothetical protein LIER_42438 [Lithospermum erythrorhizon]|uniref:DUF4283 domain-containing protein n=1 Tax=Lithospermum erythrorhizon TaxID=34254 RepID=A0AAV3RQM0_LITER